MTIIGVNSFPQHYGPLLHVAPPDTESSEPSKKLKIPQQPSSLT